MSKDTLRGKLEREFERLIWEKFRSKGLESYTQAKVVALDLLTTNRAQAEEIERLKEELNAKDKQIEKRDIALENALAAHRECHVAGAFEALKSQLATVTQERDARTQEAAQAQAQKMAIALRGSLLMPHDDLHAFREECQSILSTPTAALEAVVQRAREEEREKARAPFSADETAWLVERNMTPDGQEYLFVDPAGVLGWTTNNLKALRLSRKVDAESVVSIVEDAVRVAEHAWINSLPVDKKD